MKAKREQVNEELQVIKLFISNYARDLISKFSNVYPALLVRQLGIDKGFKGQGLGYHFILYCFGLGQLLGQSVVCAFLIMRTTKKLAEKYYVPRYNFKCETKSDLETVCIYRKLF